MNTIRSEPETAKIREAEMTTQTYMQQVTTSSYTPVIAMPWPGSFERTAKARRPTAPVCGVTESGVRDVLEAAGSLTVQDIAGALCSTLKEAQEVVWRMLDHGGLRVDEWGRLSVR